MSTYADLLAPANDLAGLRSLVMGLSANAASAAEATSGNAILYSGMLDSHHSSQVARAIAAEQNLAIIDNTPRGALMMSGDFEDALKRVVTAEFGVVSDAEYLNIRNNFLQNSSDGLWKVASVEFAGSVTGSHYGDSLPIALIS